MTSLDSTDPLSVIQYVIPILNGRDSKGKVAYGGPQTMKRARYLMILYLAKSTEVFKVSHAKEFDKLPYFTLYGLGQVAKHFPKEIDYDRRKVAMDIFKKAEETGYVHIRKVNGETYVTTTRKGDETCQKMLRNLVALTKIHDIAPKVFEEKYPSSDEFLTKKGIRSPYYFKSNADLQIVIEELLQEVYELNKIIGKVEGE